MDKLCSLSPQKLSFNDVWNKFLCHRGLKSKGLLFSQSNCAQEYQYHEMICSSKSSRSPQSWSCLATSHMTPNGHQCPHTLATFNIDLGLSNNCHPSTYTPGLKFCSARNQWSSLSVKQPLSLAFLWRIIATKPQRNSGFPNMTASLELSEKRWLLNDGSSDSGNISGTPPFIWLASWHSGKTAKAAAQKWILHKLLVIHITAANKTLYYGAQSKTSLPKSNYNPDDRQTIFKYAEVHNLHLSIINNTAYSFAPCV